MFRILSVVVLALALVGNGGTQSQQPALGLRISESSLPQQQPNRSGNVSNADQRGTDKAPLTVKLLNTGKTETEITQDREERATNEWWIRFLTLALVVATLLQFGALLYQAFWLRRTVEATENIGKAAVAVELPMVFVTKIGLNPEVSNSGDSKEWLPSQFSKIEVGFANFGRTPAIGTEICVQWMLCQDLPPEPRYDYIESLATGSIVQPQSNSSFETPASIDMAYPKEQLADVNTGTSKFWVYGFIGYRDFLGKSHKTGFCAYWVKGSDKTGRPPVFVEGGPTKYKYQI